MGQHESFLLFYFFSSWCEKDERKIERLFIQLCPLKLILSTESKQGDTVECKSQAHITHCVDLHILTINFCPHSVKPEEKNRSFKPD